MQQQGPSSWSGLQAGGRPGTHPASPTASCGLRKAPHATLGLTPGHSLHGSGKFMVSLDSCPGLLPLLCPRATPSPTSSPHPQCQPWSSPACGDSTQHQSQVLKVSGVHTCPKLAEQLRAGWGPQGGHRATVGLDFSQCFVKNFCICNSFMVTYFSDLC